MASAAVKASCMVVVILVAVAVTQGIHMMFDDDVQSGAETGEFSISIKIHDDVESGMDDSGMAAPTEGQMLSNP